MTFYEPVVEFGHEDIEMYVTLDCPECERSLEVDVDCGAVTCCRGCGNRYSLQVVRLDSKVMPRYGTVVGNN